MHWYGLTVLLCFYDKRWRKHIQTYQARKFFFFGHEENYSYEKWPTCSFSGIFLQCSRIIDFKRLKRSLSCSPRQFDLSVFDYVAKHQRWQHIHIIFFSQTEIWFSSLCRWHHFTLLHIYSYITSLFADFFSISLVFAANIIFCTVEISTGFISLILKWISTNIIASTKHVSVASTHAHTKLAFNTVGSI